MSDFLVPEKDLDMIPSSPAVDDDMIPTAAPTVPKESKKNTSSSKSKSSMSSIGEAANKCPMCDLTVFRVEQLLCSGKIWHKACFVCGGQGDQGCKKKLSSTNFSVQDHQPYCRNCYTKFLSKKGGGDEAVRSADADANRKELPSLLAHVKVSDRAAKFSDAEAANNSRPASTRFGPITNKCPKCTKSVYPAEEMRANDAVWHKSCFTCGALSEVGCGRTLARDNFLSHGGVPFCKACFSKYSKDPTFKGVHGPTASTRTMSMRGLSGTFPVQGSVKESPVSAPPATVVPSTPVAVVTPPTAVEKAEEEEEEEEEDEDEEDDEEEEDEVFLIQYTTHILILKYL